METLYQLCQQSSAVCTDTRNILPNSLFFCLKGENFNGNDFALDALQKGARAVVTDRADLQEHANCVVVDDVLQTLQQLALYHRRHLSIPVIGITGTNGKTTTKELVAAVLAKKFRIAFTQGNLNNHIGVPLTLLSIKPEDEIAIVEMGANHPGEIAQLCQLSEPTFGLITNIGKAHIEGFGSQENIIKTKSALYESVMHNEGTLFVNGDDELLCKLTESYEQVIYYGNVQDSVAEGKVVEMNPYLKIKWTEHEINTKLTGNYNLNNLLAAAAVGHTFGVADRDIVEALANYTPSNNRSQIIKNGSNTIIADFYNANPTSMAAALHNLSEIQHPQKAAILGDMRELGVESADEHRKMIALTEQLAIPALFVGEEFSKVCRQENVFADVPALNRYLATHSYENTMILIKGSRGIHLEKCELNG